MDFEMLHLALVISISGLLILTFAGGYLEPPLSSINQVNTNFLGRNVHLRGNLSDVHEFKGGSILLVLEDSSGEIDVYLPYNVAKMKSDLLNSTELEVVGSVEVYRGRLEVVVEDAGGIRAVR